MLLLLLSTKQIIWILEVRIFNYSRIIKIKSSYLLKINITADYGFAFADGITDTNGILLILYPSYLILYIKQVKVINKSNSIDYLSLDLGYKLWD